MAKSTERTLEERAARIRIKADMLCNLPSPKTDIYGDPVSYSNATAWRFDISKYDEDESYRAECDKSYKDYLRDIEAFNDLLSDIYSMLE